MSTTVHQAAARRSAEKDQAKLAQVSPPSNEVAKAWSYTDFGPAGQVAETRDVADLDAAMSWGRRLAEILGGLPIEVRPFVGE